MATILMGSAAVLACLLSPWADAEELPAKLPGVWQVDAERTRAALQRAKYEEDEIEAIVARAAVIRLTFFKEMRLVVSLPGEKRESAGKTKIQRIDAEKKQIKMLVTPEQEDGPPETVFTITVVEDDVIIVAAENERPLALARVKFDKKVDDDWGQAE